MLSYLPEQADAKLRKARAVALLDESARESLRAAERQLAVDITSFQNSKLSPVGSTVRFAGFRGEVPAEGSDQRQAVEWAFKVSMADAINMRGPPRADKRCSPTIAL